VVKRVVLLMLTAALVGLGGQALAQEHGEESSAYVQGERALQSRLLAPCCWNQTIDIHESEVTRALRAEIRRRLKAGDSPEEIEEDLVARYGPRIRAVPRGGALTGMGWWLVAAFVAAGVGVGGLVVRWARRGRGEGGATRGEGEAAAEATERDEWDERIDEELRAMD
jgi:cytochrome c-type biogenesis protein CcmH